METGRIEEARRLVGEGATFRAVAAELGVAPSTVYRWLNPEYAERHRATSRAWKQRQRGTCDHCGGETKFDGRVVRDICGACSRSDPPKPPRGRGARLRGILEFLATGEKSYSEISEANCLSRSSMSNSLYQRLIPYGFVRRVERGRYAITDDGLEAIGRRR